MIFVSHRIPVSDQLQTVSSVVSVVFVCLEILYPDFSYLFHINSNLYFLSWSRDIPFMAFCTKALENIYFIVFFPKKGQPSDQCGNERFGLLVQSQDP